ncbi:hypothetical protein JOS77_12755 [Chromobacterium haemolyticum]|nr:hypothetical protein JOS77_12755 [Chromobacterium haemolyticum]
MRTVKSAVIGLIGTAPTAPEAAHTPVLCLSEKDAAAFGPQLAGFTIPQSVECDLRSRRRHRGGDQRAGPGRA